MLNKRRSLIRLQTAIARLREAFGTVLARDITLDRLTAYVSERLASKVLPLQWRHVDLKAGVVRLDPGMTKNDEARTQPFLALPALAEVIYRQREITTTSRA